MKRLLTGCALAVFSLAVWAAPETYKIDDAHSFANWNIRHIVGRTTGTFNDIKGTLMLDPANPNAGSADVTINVFSLNSGHRERDIHVLTGDFLDGNRYPTMRFVSTGFRSTGKDTGVMTGQLTLHGATRGVEISYKILGFAPDPWGNQRAAFEGKFSLNRSDYGITKYLDSSGGGLLGNEIEITLLVEGLKLGPDGQVLNIKNQPAPAPAAQPAVTQPEQPVKKEKPDLKDLLKGILN
ncbi:MAG TPA: YceI family protein [Thiobacillaceae bacterium]|nr:YceI family protein [Thiobacillaceae bacterium]